MQQHLGTLYLVPTPIGCMDDISARSLNVLKEVDLIIAEDTRKLKLLFRHFTLPSPTHLVAFHDHNEKQKTPYLVTELLSGRNLALVSDAGTPLISDPGFSLIAACHKAQLKVVPLPGPCAAVTALSGSGLPVHRFCFEGFLPKKNGPRNAQLAALAEEERTLIFYEAPHRLMETLAAMQRYFTPSRVVCFAKELTKTWETLRTDTLRNLIAWLEEYPLRAKGEITLVVQGYARDPLQLSPKVESTLSLLLKHCPLSAAVSQTVAIHPHAPRGLVYQKALQFCDQT